MLEQQCKKIQCPKYDHDKKPIIELCMNKLCKDNNLICLKCRPQHEQHPSFVVKINEFEQFLKMKEDNTMSQELLTTFLHFKTILINKLEKLESDIKETIVKLNQNQIIENISQRCLNIKNQLKYQDMQSILTEINNQFIYDISKKLLMNPEADQKQIKIKQLYIEVINQISQFTTNQSNNTLQKTKPDIKRENQLIKQYEQIAKDQDGSNTIKQIKNNRIIVTTFKTESSCNLLSFCIPFLYKNQDMNYQDYELHSTFSIHQGYNLTMRQFEFQTIIVHSKQEKMNNCYLIRLPLTVRLLQGSTYTISMKVQEKYLLSNSYSIQSQANNFLTFILPKQSQFQLPSGINEIDDYGYFTYFTIS